MAKALRTAAFVVGAAALVATGVGAAVGAGILGATAAGATTATFLGVTAATFTAVGAIAGVAGAVLSYAAQAAAPKAVVGGNAAKFTIDKDSGIPYAVGRTYSGGKIVHRQFYGSKNEFESWVAVHSLGPVRSLGTLEVDRVPTISAGGAAAGQYANFMWLDDQLGACPEPDFLRGPFNTFPGWENNNKLSGLAADLWTLRFDSKKNVYPNGVPQRGRVIEGVFVYDPRQDSSYPGGSGSCRLGDEASYVWSENPALHAITWAFGRRQNGVLLAGGGLAVTGIDLQPFVEWANVCDLNGWKVGGVVYTDADNTWDVLKMICQAGAAEPMPVAGMLSCTFSAPRVSIGTITTNDIAGTVDVPTSTTRRVRRNTVTPKVRLESHGWEMVPLSPIAVPDFVAVDGGSRPTEIPYPLVQSVDQGTQLGLYDLVNARELEGIVLPCKVYAVGWRPGDCLTLNIPEANLIGRDVVVRDREITTDLTVTLTCRSETATKHAFCLGKSGVVPVPPDLTVPPNYTVADQTKAIEDAARTAEWSQIIGEGKPEDGATKGATADQVQAIADAAKAAEAAAELADGKIETYWQATPPAGASIGDLWIDTDDGNRLYRHDGSRWVDAKDTGIAAAIAAAAGAQGTADGKVSTYYTSTAPIATAIGDLWSNTTAGQLLRWSGTQWVLVGTNTADPNSPIGAGGKTVRDFLQEAEDARADLDINMGSIFDLAKTTAAYNAAMLLRTTLDGKDHGTLITDLTTVTEDTVETIKAMGAKSGDKKSFLFDLTTTLATPTSALAQRFSSTEAYADTSAGKAASAVEKSLSKTIIEGDKASAERLDQVEATIGDDETGLSAEVSFLRQAVVTPEGPLAKFVLGVNAGNQVAGMIGTNDGEQSALTFLFDAFT